MKALIIGASGLVGSYLLRYAPDNIEVIGTYNKHSIDNLIHFDITNKDLYKIIQSIAPDVIFLSAAFTNVEECEGRAKFCYKVNVEGVKSLLKTISKKILLVYFSTDYIFDGKFGAYDEKAIPCPINTYGTSKYLAELTIREHPNYLIIRTTGVYGWEKQEKNFVINLINNLKQDKDVFIPFDQISTPTYAGSLAKVTWELIKSGKRGIYNVVGSSLIDRYQFALLVAKVFNLPSYLIYAVHTNYLNLKAKRPLKGGLIIDKLRKLGLDMPSAINGLRFMKRELKINDTTTPMRSISK